jgi:lipoprotein-anchoring transpeptidase ErfK/SrfK
VELSGDHSGPSFAWTNLKKTSVRAAPDPKAESVLKLELRTRVPLLERADGPHGESFWRVGDGLWIDASQLNEVHLAPAPPPDVLEGTGNDQWIDVDLGEQTLVAYRGGRAVFATMISSGRSMPTPRGNYPVWAKVASTTMANQAYEDKPYMVQGVPWVLLFQGHNALHGAYWHNRFGNRKSHGCVNLAPYDARWVFEWTGPTLPTGWTGYLPSDLRRSVVVHVRDSSRPDEFEQDRPIGPPDREAEKARAEAAEDRRAESDMDAAPQYDPAFVPSASTVQIGGEAGPPPSPGPRLEPRTDPGFGTQPG